MKKLARAMAFLGCTLLLGGIHDALSQETILLDSNFGSLTTDLVADPEGNLYGLSGADPQHGGSVFELARTKDGTFKFKSLYSFGSNGPDDGLHPAPSSGLMIDSKGNLYGTTTGGAHGKGTVFEVSPESDGTWTEKILYSFGQGIAVDGKGVPNGGLVMDGEGNLYGTTSRGGVNSAGSVFELSPTPSGFWTETVLHSFPNGNNGTQEISPLVFDKSGDLLGALQAGQVVGAIFELKPSGDGSWGYSIAHQFTADSGSILLSGHLTVDENGNIYGTSFWDEGNNAGSVFELSPAPDGTWNEQVIYNFGQFSGDGVLPLGGVTLDAQGDLFGTTVFGGDLEMGGIFQLTPGQNGTWMETMLYGSGFDGGSPVVWTPEGNLVLDSMGNLYGTLTHILKGSADLEGGQVFEVNYGALTIAQPVISPNGGVFHAPQAVIITDATPNTTIHYTTDGTQPTPASPEYNGQLTISQSETLQAIAVAANQAQSVTASALFTITPAIAPPVIYPASGNYDAPQSLVIAAPDAVSGTQVYYTTDGSTPTASSNLYGGPVGIFKSETVNAIAISNGYSSPVVTASYEIVPLASGFSFPAGAVNASELVLNGGAQVIADQLHLTDSGQQESRSAWFNTRVDVMSFMVDFDFQQLNAMGDGFTFTVQNQGPNAVGEPGAGLGYEGIPASVAVKFDLFDNDGEGVSSTGLYTNGASPTVPAINLAGNLVNLRWGDPMHAHILYDGTKLILSINDLKTGAHQTHNFPVNIPQVVGSDSAYIGFTGATGDATARQNITLWSYQPVLEPNLTPAPLIFPPSGNYSDPVQVSMSGVGSVIYYTLDGTIPNASSAQYSTPFTVPPGTVVTAASPGSDITTAVYTSTSAAVHPF